MRARTVGRDRIGGGALADRTPRARFPRSVFSVGDEPDPRFTLANERTFLAWIRTALALVAAGVAVDAVALPLPSWSRAGTAAVLLLLGLALPVLAWRGWARTERALRLGRPLPGSLAALPLAVGVLIAGALVAAGALLG